MEPKPDFFSAAAASAFQDVTVAQAYQHRPPYPDAVFDILTGLMRDEPQTVLDAGCGTGYLARHLVDRVDRLDAVDLSVAMIEQGKGLPNGAHPRLNWIVGAIEDVTLNPPYALIVAGDSIHWMDWYVVMPRFSRLLTPSGHLAILRLEQLPAPWDEEFWPIRRQYSVIPNFQEYDNIAGLQDRGLFHLVGRQRTAPVPFTQSLDEYIESLHARAALSRERMRPEDAAAFGARVRALVSPVCGDTVDLQVAAEVVWGKPVEPGADQSSDDFLCGGESSTLPRDEF